MPEDKTAAAIVDWKLSQNPVHVRRRSLKSILFVLGSILFAIVSLVLALEFFVAERLSPLTVADLTKAKKTWHEHGPVSYDMEVELAGARPGNVEVKVRNRVVVAETRDGRVPPEHTWETWSIPGMLNTIELDYETSENPEQTIGAPPGTKWKLQSEFDSHFGIPNKYHRTASFGPEVYWRVKTFEAR